ncbi:unnamed protein product [Symbiodinium sp. CCMP2592]|nr:unnamed protein product [Symbiodinium sp. CCMP2592]
MDLIVTPMTTVLEWVWCAAQVGATYVELCLFCLLLGMIGALSLHVYSWQKRMILLLQGVSAQLNALESSVHSDLHAKSGSLADPMATFDLMSKFRDHELPKLMKEIEDLGTEIGVVKKQHVDVKAQLSGLQPLAGEISSMHKQVGSVTSDCAKLGGMFNRLTETHTAVARLVSTQLQEPALEKLGKSIDEANEKGQKTVHSRLDDLADKVAVLRVVVDQKNEKLLTTMKDVNGNTSQQVRDVISLVRGMGQTLQETTQQLRDLVLLVRGLGPIMPEVKRLGDLVAAGREASGVAQQNLQQNMETIQACEDRLIRVEPMITALVDQMAESETKLEAIQGEHEVLQEILGRLPKLPQRKPPAADRPAPEQTTGSQRDSVPAHPSTPPTTLGPPQQHQTVVSNLPIQTPPTIIPVSLESAAPGIQLRLSEHLNPQPPVSPAAAPNFLITQLPSQPASGNHLLTALLQNQR